MPVNPNYRAVNMEEQRGRTDSVLAFYRRLIALRHASDLVVHGTFRLLDPANEESFTYERIHNEQRLLVTCNFRDHQTTVEVPGAYRAGGTPILSNYPDEPTRERTVSHLALRPYESVVIASAATRKELEAVRPTTGRAEG